MKSSRTAQMLTSVNPSDWRQNLTALDYINHLRKYIFSHIIHLPANCIVWQGHSVQFFHLIVPTNYATIAFAQGIMSSATVWNFATLQVTIYEASTLAKGFRPLLPWAPNWILFRYLAQLSKKALSFVLVL